jgi:hypothetical protein
MGCLMEYNINYMQSVFQNTHMTRAYIYNVVFLFTVQWRESLKLFFTSGAMESPKRDNNLLRHLHVCTVMSLRPIFIHINDKRL